MNIAGKAAFFLSETIITRAKGKCKRGSGENRKARIEPSGFNPGLSVAAPDGVIIGWERSADSFAG